MVSQLVADAMSEDRAFQHLEQMAHGPVGTSDDGDVGLDHAFDDVGGDPGVPALTTLRS